MKNQKKLFFRGALILTITGVLSRVMGFFYRIFLANTIGAEGMGIYQLIFPVYAVCFALSASGIETAVSRFTAARASKADAPDTEFLKAGLLLTIFLSLSCAVFVYHNAAPLSLYFLQEPRCIPLLRVLALTIPFGTCQSCICGYYFGVRGTVVPSAAQLLEQLFRIFSVCFLYRVYVTNGLAVGPMIAVIGMVLGEMLSFLFTVTCFLGGSSRKDSKKTGHIFPTPDTFSSVIRMAFPLTLSRISINLLSGVEAALIPSSLRAFGLDGSSALSLYGVITGMSLPFILFPNALTSSISIMLLPTISEAQASGDSRKICRTIYLTITFCITMGLFFLLFFLLFGRTLGTFVFSNPLSGEYLTTLSWMCPFLYLNTTLGSILNGLGKTVSTFSNGICGLLLRIAFIFFMIPYLGIRGYLYGLLASQLLVSLMSLFSLRSYLFESPVS